MQMNPAKWAHMSNWHEYSTYVIRQEQYKSFIPSKGLALYMYHNTGMKEYYHLTNFLGGGRGLLALNWPSWIGEPGRGSKRWCIDELPEFSCLAPLGFWNKNRHNYARCWIERWEWSLPEHSSGYPKKTRFWTPMWRSDTQTWHGKLLSVFTLWCHWRQMNLHFQVTFLTNELQWMYETGLHHWAFSHNVFS